jgi:hypothetical protein
VISIQLRSQPLQVDADFLWSAISAPNAPMLADASETPCAPMCQSEAYALRSELGQEGVARTGAKEVAP